jgi:hypothetical protein
MKKLVTIILLLFFTRIIAAQFSSFGFIAGGGITIIDVAKVVEPNILSDWNTLSMTFKGFGEYKIGEGKAFGIEAGANRLYYWEYPAPGYSWYNWKTEWTYNAVFYFSKSLGDRFYLQSGAGLHIFNTGGTVLGIMVGGGASFYLSENIILPVFMRIEPIFGTATPVAINFGTGLRYNLIK